jgi:hypothetical protein
MKQQLQFSESNFLQDCKKWSASPLANKDAVSCIHKSVQTTLVCKSRSKKKGNRMLTRQFRE